MLNFDEWNELWETDIEKEFEESGSTDEYSYYVEERYMGYVESNEDCFTFEDVSSIHLYMTQEVLVP